jgi:hypothetical protein
MKRDQIIEAATTLSATDFLELAEAKQLAPTILDQDNILDPNDGYLNVIVNGLARGEALLFIDGVFYNVGELSR